MLSPDETRNAPQTRATAIRRKDSQGRRIDSLSRKIKGQRTSEAAEDAADVACLTRVREKGAHYRPLENYLRECKERI